MWSDSIVQMGIKELSPNSKDFKLVGVIISKRGTRSFTDNKNSTRSVWNFTLRDSPLYFINVAAWGSEEYIDKLFTTFNVGDIVELINVRVALRKAQDETKYQPVPTSAYDLTLSEGKSEINFYSGSDIGHYERSYHLPTKHPESYVKLSDIVYYTQHNQERRDINLLVAVKYIGLTRTIRTKRGDTTVTREIDLMDDTHSGFPFTMWGTEVVGVADKWTPRETVLFIADVNLSYNEYRKAWTLSSGPKTVFTPNPETSSGRVLREFAKGAPLDAKSVMQTLVNTCDVSQINTILSCKSILDKINSLSCVDHFSAIVYAVVTEYDLDGPNKLVITKCDQCGIVLDDTYDVCVNALCPGNNADLASTSNMAVYNSNMAASIGSNSNMAAYNVRISLSDHTGQIKNCHLSEQVAVSMIGREADKFNVLPTDMRTQIKWKYLLKRVCARLIILPGQKFKTPMISVVGNNLVPLAEYTSKVPPF
uniref:Meiosis-specific with OB domain-containing protein n=1 Tax=Cacopsylla melanoneura TaxID=428564 RepID=A0A8D9F6J0_9HEMI